MPMTRLDMDRALTQLRLSGIKATLEARTLQATQGNLPFLEVFSLLLQDELDRRQSRSIERRLRQSGLTEWLSLDGFDWSFNPKLPKGACLELLTLRFLKEGQDVLLLGAPGTGKSHIAKALTHAAGIAGYKIFYREAAVLFAELFEAAQLGKRKSLMEQIQKADLVVLDDLFLTRKLPPDAADDLQEIVTQRYRVRSSTMITSNRVVGDWGKHLGDTALAGAILDRLMHHGHFLQFEGKSYRLKEASARLSQN